MANEHVREFLNRFDEDTARRWRTPEREQQRERGLWSFLTWSFFLSQLAFSSVFMGSAAKAAGDTDPGAASSGAPSASANSTTIPFASDPRTAADDQSSAGDARSSVAPPQGERPSLPSTTNGTDAADLALKAELAADARASEQGGRGATAPVTADGAPVIGEDPAVQPAPSIPVIDITDPTSVLDGLPQINIVLSPVLDTVDNLIEGLGPVLDGILTPAVETLDDLVGALNPTLNLVLDPVVDVVEDVVALVEPVLDPVVNALNTVTDVVGQTVEPVLDAVGEVVALVEPVVDPVVNVVEDAIALVEPVLEPVANIANTIMALADPVIGILSPSNPNGTENNLFENGGYTEYGIALNDVLPGGEGGALNDIIDDIELPITISGLPGNDDDNAGNGLPISIAGIVDSVGGGLRGLHDGLL